MDKYNKYNKMSETDIDTDLYSRQLYVLGEDAMRKMKESNILISGMSGLGVEIAKNTVLSGVKSITIHDNKNVKLEDIGTNYYLDDKSIGFNRAESCVKKLSELNSYVIVNSNNEEITSDYLKNFHIAVFANKTHDELIKLNNMCRESETKFIIADSVSVFGRVFNDFGDNFVVLDTDGEDCKNGIIESVHFDNKKMYVRTVEKHPHELSSGQFVKLKFEGLEMENYDTIYQIEYVDMNTFSVEFDEEVKGNFISGVFEQHKPSKKLEFDSYEKSFKNPKFMQDDIIHPERNDVLHNCFYLKDSDSFENDFRQSYKNDLSKSDSKMVNIFEKTRYGECVFTNSVIGGFTAQQIMIACSGKFTPIHQYMYFESVDSIPENIKYESLIDNRYKNMFTIFGTEFMEKLNNMNTFVVGAGAIGCELLKNFSMAGVSTKKGKTYVTDMDTIERSNLNRQFLFNSDDINKYKSECASNAVSKMNPDMNIEYHKNMVCEKTEDIYNTEFYSGVDVVINALDNLEARRYMDNKCVHYSIPLLESGTLGTKGNTQVIVPNITESYSDTYDPPDKSIPACTIKNFPYKIEHTVHWAKEKFEQFTGPPMNVKRFIDNPEIINDMNIDNIKTLIEDSENVLNKNLCKSYKDCVKKAVFSWTDNYRNQILDILNYFPEDYVTDSGAKFWSGTKKCPTPVKFDVSNDLHMQYVYTMSMLFADVYNVKSNYDWDTFTFICKECLKDVPEYKKSNKKVAATDEEAEEEEKDKWDNYSMEELKNKLPEPDEYKWLKLTPLKFEKDDDTNYHIDYITACSNMRAINYEIEPADRLTTKKIAGNIIPAIATTTSIVAGLVCLELCKIVNNVSDIEKYRNYFLNLAIPFSAYSEPGAIDRFEFNGKKYTKWNNVINLNGYMTLSEMINIVKNKLKGKNEIEISGIFYGTYALYFEFNKNKKHIKERMTQSIVDVLNSILNKSFNDSKEIILNVQCSEVNDDEENDQEFNIIYTP